jgi:hypothetical protein
MCPFRNEHPLDFGKRVQIIRSRLAAKLNTLTEREMPSLTKAVYMKKYDQLAQKTFIIHQRSTRKFGEYRETQKPNFHRTRNVNSNRRRKFQIYTKFQ